MRNKRRHWNKSHVRRHRIEQHRRFCTRSFENQKLKRLSMRSVFCSSEEFYVGRFVVILWQNNCLTATIKLLIYSNFYERIVLTLGRVTSSSFWVFHIRFRFRVFPVVVCLNFLRVAHFSPFSIVYCDFSSRKKKNIRKRSLRLTFLYRRCRLQK